MEVTRKGKTQIEKGKENSQDSMRSQWNNFGKESRFGVLANVNERIADRYINDNEESSTSLLNNHTLANYNFINAKIP